MTSALLTRAQTRRHFGVSNSTLERWEAQGLLDVVRTERGHRRYPVGQVPHTGTLLTPGQARRVLGTTSATNLRRWAEQARLDTVVIPGGGRRYLADQVQALAVGLAARRNARSGMPPKRSRTAHTPRGLWSDAQRRVARRAALATEGDGLARLELLAALGLAREAAPALQAYARTTAEGGAR